jgi:hypothetical protein
VKIQQINKRKDENCTQRWASVYDALKARETPWLPYTVCGLRVLVEKRKIIFSQENKITPVFRHSYITQRKTNFF